MTTRTVRSAAAVRIGLVAALAAAVAVGSYDYFSAAGSGTSASGGGTSISGPAVPTDGANPTGVAPFTTADVGSCLTWDIAADGTVSNFQQADCSAEHRFEISARENLATYPSSEFGTNATMPDLTRQAQLREELCHTPTMRYLGGRFDPVGRYSIAPILPSAEAWAAGDRTMLCGVQATDAEGTSTLTVGAAAEQDQAVVAEPGACVFVDESRSLRTVDCAADHQLETTLVVDLAPVFPEGTPSIEDQDNHLRDVCFQAAIGYLGEEENLYQSTLQPYWGTLQEVSWVGGSRSVNCSLVFADAAGGFATLNGTARDGRGGFTINGQPPAEPPPRNPLREPGA
ncbi:septum formation family protein [Corynebacterium comes]|uniref:Membrane protein n=1 Tax=Corynebacterium comes TaxID=2675218 RepID=A0A6B8VNV5_9CORY|nr:septum formation family protein [Corynebacterium comes]QGU05733.1 putative membrane protein [Corynebacterium comes]